MPILKETKQYKEHVLTLIELAKLCSITGQFNESIKHVLAAHKYCIKYGLDDSMLYVYMSKAEVYFKVKEYTNALSYINKVKHSAMKEKDYLALIDAFILEQSIYSHLNRHTEALHCAKLAVYFAHKVKQNSMRHKAHSFFAQLDALILANQITESKKLYEYLDKRKLNDHQQWGCLHTKIIDAKYRVIAEPTVHHLEQIKVLHQQLVSDNLLSIASQLSAVLLDKLPEEYLDKAYYTKHLMGTELYHLEDTVAWQRFLEMGEKQKKAVGLYKELKILEENEFKVAITNNLRIQPGEKMVVFVGYLGITPENFLIKDKQIINKIYMAIQHVITSFFPEGILGNRYKLEYCLATVMDESVNLEGLVEQVRKQLTALTFMVDGQVVSLNLKVGISECSYEGRQYVPMLFDEADSALYYAKHYSKPVIYFEKNRGMA